MARSAALVMVAAVLLSASLSSQGRGEGQNQPYPRLPAPPVKSPADTTAPDIPGVVRGGTKVQLIRDLFHSTESPIAMPDGSLLFTEQDAGDGQLIKIDKDDKISTFVTNTNRTIGLAYDTKGRLVGVESNIPRIEGFLRRA
jgi:glucose/arabinose dehydrogenase